MGIRIDNSSQSPNTAPSLNPEGFAKVRADNKDAPSSKVNNERAATNAEVRDFLKQDPKDVEKAIKEAVENQNKAVKFLNPAVQFAVDDDTHQIIAKVVDSSDGEKVIRQIPSEELLALSKKISEIRGLIFDKKE